MISVAEALDHIFSLTRQCETETVPLRDSAGRVLAEQVVAKRPQPPFRAATMDGYAVRAEVVETGAQLTVIGEAPAGTAFSGKVGVGDAVRIFTGAPVPEGADKVVIQEDVERVGETVTLSDAIDAKANIRPIGADFELGATIAAPRLLGAADLGLIAAMNVPKVVVRKRPVVALLATGDELVLPGEDPRADQIISSNSFSLAPLLEAHGAEVRVLPIASDTAEHLNTAFDLAADADLLITIGGASVGDHDLVGPTLEARGATRSFYKVAMRPGKPLMAGRMGEQVVIGLPGNPVSAMVCTMIFVIPALRSMLGLPDGATPTRLGTLAHDLPANGPRQHYMRATMENGALTVARSQDSALLSVLANSDALVVRPPNDPEQPAGSLVSYVPI